MGYHHDPFYEVQKAFNVGGVSALVEQRRWPMHWAEISCRQSFRRGLHKTFPGRHNQGHWRAPVSGNDSTCTVGTICAT